MNDSNAPEVPDEMARAILRKIMDGGYVDLDSGIIDVRVSLSAEEDALMESLRAEEDS